LADVVDGSLRSRTTLPVPCEDRTVSAGLVPPTIGQHATPPRRLPRVWPWIVVLVVGVALVPVGVGLFVARGVVPLFDHTPQPTPATLRLSLNAGDYFVFQQSGLRELAPPGEVTPGDVAVRGSDGTTILVAYPGSDETLESQGVAYEAVAGFHVASSGSYLVHVRSPGGEVVFVFVSASIGTVVGSQVGWIALVPIGTLLAFGGLIGLIVAGTRRSRRRREAAAPPVPRCARGHTVGYGDRFCPACGAPVALAPTGSAP
jgi:hypothetical protein